MAKAIKFFKNNGGFITSPHTGLAYVPGNLYRTSLPLVMCANGFHFPSNLLGIEEWGLNYYASHLTSWIIEISGVIIEDDIYNKFAVQNMKLIEEVPITIRSFDRRNSLRELKSTLRNNHPDLIYFNRKFRSTLLSVPEKQGYLIRDELPEYSTYSIKD